MSQSYLVYFILVCIALYLVKRVVVRLRLSKAKHPSLRGHSKWSRRIAGQIPFFAYQESEYFSTDGAPEHIVESRSVAFDTLKKQIQDSSPKTLAHSEPLENSISDVRFTSNYRIPFPYRNQLSKEFKLGSIADQTQGSKIKDLDGNWRYDLSGSYGVNVFGYDFYKDCMAEGMKIAGNLGPVLGAYHPVIAENVEMIKQVSGLDEVSFHMSGTEAVMQAVRLARYHTGKTHLVRLCGAYHGWWDGVQPGIGNNRKTNDVYTLSDLSDNTLGILDSRDDIACVLINPLQAFHPNSDSASDVSLIASDRAANFDKQAYILWLEKIRAVCTKRNIVLIFDEVFTGFRLSYRGAQGFFGIQADLVTYGKTLGGGYPVGVVAGTHKLMKRYKDNKPVDVSFARGTFNSHPYVMGAMNAFLTRVNKPEIQAIYQSSEDVWNNRVSLLNQRLDAAKLPLKIVNMHSILSVIYTRPSRYNWMFQFYLRNAGLELSWTGTGRFIMNLSYTDEEFAEVIDRIVTAAQQMEKDGWWWSSPTLTNKAIKQQFLSDMLSAKFPLLAPFLSKPLSKHSAHVTATSAPISSSEQLNAAPENPIQKAG
ncbi:aminotransferase class III-fold pyridoxal phosphate-dependent enzyme [Paraglaciecola aquimarina]|uniref:Aminotransferase class III-fold pyridoxal phosphate-dependent enzyme n=1 Tax=Paraglaciecola aquimarina TaxID=1235557 RepID=A0ABU3SRV0_9ALTE|nr:aminotransferase class III-fold pyridoxal phosphate-dependent enzyme [Paraglaciecola aquimarina]MDU0352719.1 aminotransferase class III-fold pyridoxal phosphate-dependent enzyme [Paraglaciecola aquimarina]